MKFKVTQIHLTKSATIFEECNDTTRVTTCLTVAKTIAFLSGRELSEAAFEFHVYPDATIGRQIKTFTKRAQRIAEGLKLQIGEPVNRVEQGYVFDHVYRIPIIGNLPESSICIAEEQPITISQTKE